MPSPRLLALAALLSAASVASAQTVINSVPYTINVSGKYALGNNLITASPSQTAITISAPNVVLDLNQFFVSGPGTNSTSTTAVISVAAVSNVTIRNGTVANNGYGISFNGGSNSINHLVESLNVTRCYIAGIYFSGTPTGCLVRNNVISQIGNSTSPNSGAAGIVLGGGARAEGNSIIGVVASGSASSYGISAYPGDFVIGNTISNCKFGVDGGKYQANLTYGCTTNVGGGTDAGLNN